MSPEEIDGFADLAAAYVHIPFCSAICPYCDFAVVAGQDDLAERYVTAVLTEIAMSEPWRRLDAVYFGGGTPSHVAPELLVSIVDGLKDRHGVAADAEISLEANPEDFDVERAGELRAGGFNRVSFGAQSFDRDVLRSLGRRHDSCQIVSSVEAARSAGFENVSTDLIFGTPGETDRSWRRSLETAIGQGVDHISCYALTVERGTALSRAVAFGAPAPDGDVQAARYEAAEKILFGSGFGRYEVSNWSQPGHECRYNMVVWAQGQYEAYGNGAHGYRRGIRFRNHRRLEAYLDRVETGRSARAGEELIEGWDSELDRLFVGLRRSTGVPTGPGTDALLAGDEGKALCRAGVIEVSEGRLRVLKPLLTDAVHRSILALSPLSS